MQPPFLRIEHGELHSPERCGPVCVLIGGERILYVGQIDRRDLDRLPMDYRVISAKGAMIVPSLIDPHEHLLGASGNSGFATATPPIFPQGSSRKVTGTLFSMARNRISFLVRFANLIMPRGKRHVSCNSYPGLLGRTKSLINVDVCHA